MNDAERDKTLEKIKIQLLLKGSTFITTVAFNLKFSWTNKIPTAATDGATLLFNPDFFDALSSEERLFVYCHEIWHCCFLHMIRRGDRDPTKWNQAADHVINLMLLSQGYTMPDDGLADPIYRGKSTDEIYDLLPDPPKEDNFILDLLEPGEGDGEDGKSKGDLTAEAKVALEDLIIRATQSSKLMGDAPGIVPGEIEVNLQELLSPVLPWENLLARFMDEHFKTDYSWKRPNRRLLHTAYLPSLWGESITSLTVAVDTSCSVRDEQFAAFISEMNYMRECFPIEEMKVISFDTEIKNIDTLKEGDDIRNITFHGRGGTDMVDVFKHIKKNPTKVVIIFSDLEVHIPKQDFDTPILYVCVDNPSRTIEEGTLIHFNT